MDQLEREGPHKALSMERIKVISPDPTPDPCTVESTSFEADDTEGLAFLPQIQG